MLEIFKIALRLKDWHVFMWQSLQSVVFKLPSYCFKETIGFEKQASFASLQFRFSSNQVKLQKNFIKRLFNSRGHFIDWKLQIDKGFLTVFNTLTLKQVFWKTKTFWTKLEYSFLVQSTTNKSAAFPCKTCISMPH